MKIIYKSHFKSHELRYNVELSQEEWRSHYKDGHELKCFLYWEDNKLKNTSNYDYQFYCTHEYPDRTVIEFQYQNRKDKNLVINFNMTFPHQKNFNFDKIQLMHLKNKACLGYSNEEFKAQALQDIKEIVEKLLGRDSSQYLCNSCIYNHKKKLDPQCEKLYTAL